MIAIKEMDMPEKCAKCQFRINLGYLMTMEIMKTNVLSQAAL